MINNKTIVIIGCGRLGSSIAKKLSNDGENVLVIDKNIDSFNKLDDFSGFTQCGDATDLLFLENLNISKAKAIVITTESDEVNVYLGHVCFVIFNSQSIYIRLSDANKAKLLDNTPIKAIYPFLLSLNAFIDDFKEDKKLWK